MTAPRPAAPDLMETSTMAQHDTDPPRRLLDLARGFADVFAAWWLGFSKRDYVTADDLPDIIPPDASELDTP